jgi:hypothetical protein
MSECSGREEAPPVVTLGGRQWSREELLARVGRLEQVAGMRLVEGRGRGRTDFPLRGAGDGPGMTGPRLSATRQLRTPEEVSDGKR